MANIRPSWPPPSMPNVEPGGSVRGDCFIVVREIIEVQITGREELTQSRSVQHLFAVDETDATADSAMRH